jgi:hypothetical protein
MLLYARVYLEIIRYGWQRNVSGAGLNRLDTEPLALLPRLRSWRVKNGNQKTSISERPKIWQIRQSKVVQLNEPRFASGAEQPQSRFTNTIQIIQSLWKLFGSAQSATA